MPWYYIGPDKTGLTCPDCCAAFYSSGGSCIPRPCSVSGSSVFRNYVCPSTTFPTEFHYYKVNPATGNVTIAPNPRKCSTVASECATYTPTTGLNAAARIGSGCSQSYVTSEHNCSDILDPCPNASLCNTCGLSQYGNIVYPRSCNPNPSGHCSCSSDSANSYNGCNCVCLGPGGICCQSYDSTADCYCGSNPDGNPCTPCPDGSEDCGGFGCCGGASVPSCTSCQEIVCEGGDTYVCSEKPCYPASRPGYSCSCGQLVCNTSSTCCVGPSWGYTWISSTKECRSCGYGYPSVGSSCCDSTFRRKGCSLSTSICCNDGLCYDSSTTLCKI